MQDDDPEIRRIVLAGMRQALPSARTEARVLAGLLAQVSSAPPPDVVPDGGAAIAAGAAAGTTLKVIVGATILATAIVGGTIAATRPNAPTEPTPPVAAASPPPPTPIAAPKIVAPASAPTPAPALRPAPAPAPAPKHAPKHAAPARVTDDLAAETELLASAEAALAQGDPTRALELAAMHADRHPHGQLAVEREAIATAAACVAARPGATEAAARFVREHPKTAAAAKVRTRCEPAPRKSEGQ